MVVQIYSTRPTIDNALSILYILATRGESMKWILIFLLLCSCRERIQNISISQIEYEWVEVTEENYYSYVGSHSIMGKVENERFYLKKIVFE